MKLLKPAKRACVRKEKKCDSCGKTLIGTHSLKRHLLNVHNICNENIKTRNVPSVSKGVTQGAVLQETNVMSNKPTPNSDKWKKMLYQKYQSSVLVKLNDGSTCACQYACDENCLNRALATECDPGICIFKAKCDNTVIQKNNQTPVERFVTHFKGNGIRAIDFINKGAYIMEYTGDIITKKKFQHRVNTSYKNHRHHYGMDLDGNMVIDAYKSGGDCKFVNHSCDPNCRIEKWTIKGEQRLALFAIKDIQAKEELTFDYNFTLFTPGNAQICKCNSQNCRGHINRR